MLRTCLLISIIFAVSIQGWSQNPGLPDRCNTTQYLELQKQKDPALEMKMQAMEKALRKWIISHPQEASGPKDIVTIPVIVHVVYNTPEENITDEQIWSQFWVLNEDYRRLNPDSVNTPVMFRPVAGDSRIEFCMARRTPQNTMTNGIDRVYTDSLEFGLNDWVKSAYSGGAKAWNSSKYLNIWVCKLAANFLGYAQYPGGNDSTDGVVIDYRVFGKIGSNLNPHYNRGRTATHEIGHWLNLYHPWGEGESNPDCTGSDSVADTPVCAGPNYYCPTHPHTTNCNSTGEMFMNYMDYVDDACFNLFTKGQGSRMWAAINLFRPGLLNSDGCDTATGIAGVDPLESIRVFPNPTTGIIMVNGYNNSAVGLNLSITDILGREVFARKLEGTQIINITIDLSGKPKGMYFLRLYSQKSNKVVKLAVR